MEWTAVDGPLLSERLPFFMQLDLRVDRLWRRRTAIWNLYLDIQNVTNRLNPEGVTYSDDFATRSYTRGLPIFPSLGIEYRPIPSLPHLHRRAFRDLPTIVLRGGERAIRRVHGVRVPRRRRHG